MHIWNDLFDFNEALRRWPTSFEVITLITCHLWRDASRNLRGKCSLESNNTRYARECSKALNFHFGHDGKNNSIWKWTRGQRRIDVKACGFLDSSADCGTYVIIILSEEWVELVWLEYMGLICGMVGMRIWKVVRAQMVKGLGYSHEKLGQTSVVLLEN